MTDVFISYSRKDIAFARLLHQALAESGLETWIDWQDIPPSADWLAEVYEAIEGADAFVFVISETSLGSEICGLEIDHAAKHNKRLIPIVIKDVEAEQVPKELAVLNWIFFEEAGEKFAEAMEDLVTAITADQPWIKAHTRFENRALGWEKKDGDRGLLLRGADLSEAEAWLTGSAGKDPQPTALQTQYILKSREDSTRRQRLTLTGVGIGLVVAVGLGILAWTQRNVAVAEGYARATAQYEAIAESEMRATAQAEAEAQTITAQSRELAALARNLLETRLDLGTLLSIESVRMEKNYLSVGSLMQSLQTQGRVSKIIHSYSESSSVVDMEIRSVVFHPSGKYFVSGDINGFIRFWDPIAGKEINQPIITLDTAEVYQLAISRDGVLLASANKSSLQVWNLEDENELMTKDLGYSYYGVTFSPDNKFIATINLDEKLRIWDISTGELKVEKFIQGSGRPQSSVFYSPNGNSLVVYAPFYGVYFLDPVSGEEIREKVNLIPNGWGVAAFDISPDGNSFAMVDTKNNVFLYDLENDRLISKIESTQNDWITDLEFSREGKVFFTVNYSDIVSWDAKTGAQIGTILSHFSQITDIVISPDGSYLISGSNDGTIRIIAISSTEPFFHKGTGRGIAFSPFNELVAIALETSRKEYAIGIWDSSNFELMNFITLDHVGPFTKDLSINFHPDNMLIVNGKAAETIHFYNLDNKQEIGEPITRQNEWIHGGAVLSPDGMLLASSNYDGAIILTDVQTRAQIGSPLLGHDIALYGIPAPDDDFSPDTDNYVRALAFSPDGATLASGGNDTTVRLWNLRAGVQIGEPLLGHTNRILSVAFNSDGKTIASSDEDGNIILWDLVSMTQIKDPLIGYDNQVYKILFNKDGTLLISAGKDGTIRLWDVENHQQIGLPIIGDNSRQFFVDLPHIDPLLGYEGHTTWVTDIALSPDGTKLISEDCNDHIRIWELDINVWIERACTRAGRNMTQEEWDLYLPFDPYYKTCPQFP